MSTQTALSPRVVAPVLAQSSWMNALDDGRETLRATGAVLTFAADREIFAEGGPADVFFKVASGVVRTCKFLSDGRRQIEAFYSVGDVFGFDLSDQRRLSAEAVTDCNLIAYRRRSVEAAAPRDEVLSRQLLSYAMHSVASAQDHSLLLGRRGAAEKVAVFLLEWAPADSTIQLAMSRQDIADYLGLTIETVSRTLSQMERDHLIAIPNARQIRVCNREALEDLAA